MLKNIDPALNADVLYALRSMGHGDQLAIVDTNFPADAIARQTALGQVLRIDNVTASRAMRAVLSVLPLDTPLQNSVGRMEVVGAPDQIPTVQLEVQTEVDRAEGNSNPMYGIEPFAFCTSLKMPIALSRQGKPDSMAASS
jgi:L-fucose mutarotase